MNQYEVIWTNSAQFDLELIIEYLKSDDIAIAKKIFDAIKKKCESLHHFPKRNRIVPELQQIGITKYREIIYKRYRIVYKIDKTKVYIMAVIDSSRNFEDILFHRLFK